MRQESDRKTVLFVQTYEKYKEPFIRFANSFVRDREVAENLFADSFMDYWIRRHSLPSDTNVPAYILTTLRHKALNWLRSEINRQKASERISSDMQREMEFRANSLENFTVQSLFTKDIQDIVDRALASMPVQTRRIFEMSRFSNKKNHEIADLMGVSVKTVEYHISKVLKVLKSSLKDYVLFCLVFIMHKL